MTAGTEGGAAAQASYKARLGARARRLGPAYGIGQFNHPWDQMNDGEQADEEAGARAAIEADGSRQKLSQVRAIVFRSGTQAARIRQLVELLVDGDGAAPAMSGAGAVTPEQAAMLAAHDIAERFWAWMDSYVGEPQNQQYEAADMERAWDAGRLAAAAPAQPAPGVTVDQLRAAVEAHRSADDDGQWYVDQHVIDCDAGDFWRVVAGVIAAAPAVTAPDPALVLADDEIVSVRACSGGVIIIAFAPGAPLDHAAELRDAVASQCDVPVIAVSDVAAIRAWEPEAPAREREALEDIARAITGCTDTGLPLDRDWLTERAVYGLGQRPADAPGVLSPHYHTSDIPCRDCQLETAMAENEELADETERLRADLADAEAQLAKWPRCPSGCSCRFGTDDADRNECGCDGLCNGIAEPAPGLALLAAEEKYLEAERTIDDYREEVGRLTAALDRERTARLHMAGERDEARSDYRRLRAVLLEDGQPDAAVRKRCLAIIATAGTSRRVDDELAAAPELSAALAETRTVRDGYARLCEEFGHGAQSGMTARLSLTVLNRHREAAGLKARRPGKADQ